MTVSALIPARLHSTRLEKKLLKNLKGIPLIVRTYQAVNSSNLFDEVKVVTDSDEIIDVLKKNNIAYFKSIKPHKTGTDRIAEFADDMKSDIIINIQGDEPFVIAEEITEYFGSAVQLLYVTVPPVTQK